MTDHQILVIILEAFLNLDSGRCGWNEIRDRIYQLGYNQTDLMDLLDRHWDGVPTFRPDN